MKINLHIDQIVVEGASLTRREREDFAAALEHELATQLCERVNRERGWPAGAARQDQDARGVSPLGSRIAHEVLAVLPVGALAGSRPGRLPAPGRRQSRREHP